MGCTRELVKLKRLESMIELLEDTGLMLEVI